MPVDVPLIVKVNRNFLITNRILPDIHKFRPRVLIQETILKNGKAEEILYRNPPKKVIK